MPGLIEYLPSLDLPPYLCTNCGFWQRHFDKPVNCPLCLDARHVLPEKGWHFLRAEEAEAQFPMHWEELFDGVWRFWNNPVMGIGPHSYLLTHPEGNVLFEGATIYSQAALAKIESLGGVYLCAASHPHTYGALWQIQRHFDAQLAIHTGDYLWTPALKVTHPFSGQLPIQSDIRLVETGIHFAGHSMLYDHSRRLLLCGDALKFDLSKEDPRQAVSISTHKAFVRAVPITQQEADAYAEVFSKLDFKKTYTPFEQAHNVDTELISKFFQRVHDHYPEPHFVPIETL